MDPTLPYALDQAVGYAVGHAAAKIKIALRRVFVAAGHDVTPDQWVVLNRLAETAGLTQAGLGERTVKDKTTITRILDRLEEKGLLIRQRDPRDRRSQRLFLTPAGEATVRRLVPLVQTFAAAAYADLTEEDRSALRRLLGCIEDRLDAMLEPKDAV